MRRVARAIALTALCVCAALPAMASAASMPIGAASGPTWASVTASEITAAGTMTKDVWSTYWLAGAPTGTLVVEGTVYNNDAVAYTDVLVTVTFRDAADRPMATFTGPGSAHLVAPGDMTTFTCTGLAPAGYSTVVWSASGKPAKPGAVEYSHGVAGSVTTDTVGYRHYSGTLLNSTGATVTSVVADGYERQGATELSAMYSHTLVDQDLLSTVITPGGSAPFDAVGRFYDDGNPGTSWYSYIGYRSVGLSPRSVYRFFKPGNGTHFYTASEAEKNNVMATLGHVYAYEGVSYAVNTLSPSNMQPLHRFYRPSTGTHFYTASEAEKTSVQATLGHIYAYEGVAYEVSTHPFYSRPVHRFFRPGNGTHFYTASEAEKNNVMATLGHVYAYEGVAFYLAY